MSNNRARIFLNNSIQEKIRFSRHNEHFDLNQKSVDAIRHFIQNGGIVEVYCARTGIDYPLSDSCTWEEINSLLIWGTRTSISDVVSELNAVQIPKGWLFFYEGKHIIANDDDMEILAQILAEDAENFYHWLESNESLTIVSWDEASKFLNQKMANLIPTDDVEEESEERLLTMRTLPIAL